MNRAGRIRRIKTLLIMAMLAVILQPSGLFACAACYGKSDSPMAWGMNAGILTLLVIIGVVLSGITGFFVYIIKRAAKISADELNSNQN